jgi:RNA recognition motif-containing protein
MNILIRNMSRLSTEGEIQGLFNPFGTVRSVTIVMDAATGKSKGFGFVEMPVQAEAARAVKALNKKTVRGVSIRVKPSKSRPKEKG